MAKILVVSGELSGDLHASGLVRALKKLIPDASCYAMGGDNLKAAGAKIIADINELSVMGFTEVLCKIRTIKSILRRVLNWIKTDKPDLIILVDFPTFNFKIAKFAYYLNIPVVYYIPPKIWASRYKRINFIKKYIKFVILIFPFELDIYQKEGIDAFYAGNPLQNILSYNTTNINTDNLCKAYPLIAVLPGSRRSELKYHSIKIINSMKLIKTRYPDAFFVFPFKKGIDASFFIKQLGKSKISQEWYNITDSMETALPQSDIIIVASGTASLEAAFYKKPIIIVYYLNYLTYIIAKIIVKIKYIGLINILSNKKVVPELIEKQFTSDNVYDEVVRYLEDEQYRDKVISEIKTIINSLKTAKDPFEKAAELIFDKINLK